MAPQTDRIAGRDLLGTFGSRCASLIDLCDFMFYGATHKRLFSISRFFFSSRCPFLVRPRTVCLPIMLLLLICWETFRLTICWHLYTRATASSQPWCHKTERKPKRFQTNKTLQGSERKQRARAWSCALIYAGWDGTTFISHRPKIK